MNSWRTSVIGAVLIVGAVASLVISALVNKRVPATEDLMLAGGSIATGVGLISARDNNKSSEDVGANRPSVGY
ncbi:MAG TPA: hypothetical protein VGB76_06785 [Pyrinomonadaceae bacterium]|jgi:drug/metabolite transporter (DMT)-like permease